MNWALNCIDFVFVQFLKKTSKWSKAEYNSTLDSAKHFNTSVQTCWFSWCVCNFVQWTVHKYNYIKLKIANAWRVFSFWIVISVDFQFYVYILSSFVYSTNIISLYVFFYKEILSCFANSLEKWPQVTIYFEFGLNTRYKV